MPKEFSFKYINSLKPKDKEFEVRDTEVEGLCLRVYPSGKMVYSLVYGRGKRVKIDNAKNLDHTQAREAAREMLAKLRIKGIDPIVEKNQAKAENYLVFLTDTYLPWLNVHHKHPKETYDILFKCFPELHKLPLAKITNGVINKWRTRRKGEITNSSINRQLSDLRSCLRRATEIWELQTGITKIKQEKTDKNPKTRYLNENEEIALYKALANRDERMKAERESANQWRSQRDYPLMPDLRKLTYPDHLTPCITLALNSGLRRGEILKLKWKDVDIEEKTLTVAGATSKSGNTRIVFLNQDAIAGLTAWKKQQKVKSLDGYVFVDDEGNRIQGFKSSWKNLLKDAKIKKFRFHDCRHHYASRLVQLGVDLNIVREQLGHQTYAMTLRYSHLSPEVKQSAVDKLVSRTEKIAVG